MQVEPAFPALPDMPRMTQLTFPNDGSHRLFVTLQPGEIKVFPNDPGASSAQTFLDITDRVNDSGSEEGLLGLAFDPDYAQNGYFYVDYTAISPRRSVISRFTVSASDPNVADPSSELVILEVAQPYPNHNGGSVVFGPDGYLYISFGDGGSGGDPQRNGQNTSVLLGKILRIDVRNARTEEPYRIPPDNPFAGSQDKRQEVWAYGLRNPWKITFDSLTGDLWAGDVGQNGYEELDIIRPGLNYGWNIMEGAHCYPETAQCDRTGLELPVAEYPTREGCAVTGGYVYRGQRLPELYGAYIYGDYCGGQVWALRWDGARVTEQMLLIDTDLRVPSFGVDAEQELYLLDYGGKIYRLAMRQ